MNNDTKTATVSFALCQECGLDLLPSQRFCRLCGASQSHLEIVSKRDESPSNHSLSTNTPAGLSEKDSLVPAVHYHSISGSILNSFVATDLTSATTRMKSRVAKRAVAAAITLPLWLMIVLLSPLDALEASRQVIAQL